MSLRGVSKYCQPNLVLAILFGGLAAAAAAIPDESVSIEGIGFLKTLSAKTGPLVLNGVGVRTATLFKVRVYAAGLYLAQPSKNENEIIASSADKALHMVFLRKVDASDIQKSWTESFKQNCGTDCEALTPSLTQLLSWMTTVQENDRMAYTFSGSTISVAVNGDLKGSISNQAFARIILSTWIGQHPPTEKLKEGLLGKL